MKYITNIKNTAQLSDTQKDTLIEVTDKYKYRSNSYYNNLINWDDENDPIKNIIIPNISELEEVYDELDASGEHNYTKVQGLEHKYQDTALILFNNICGGYCRFCFRKRLFIEGNDDIANDLDDAIQYIQEHQEINNVLITGGDPFIGSGKKLFQLIDELIKIEHLDFIRIGTKMLVFNPSIFLNQQLIDELKRVNKIKKIRIINHINHPNEITDETKKATSLLLQAGIQLYNQTPIIKGVNDNAKTIKLLLLQLSKMGIVPYYFFQMRPTAGNFGYSVAIEQVVKILNEAFQDIAGIVKNIKYIMSHESGKIEIIGINANNIIMKYHRAAKESNNNKILILRRNKDAHWLDDYEDI